MTQVRLSYEEQILNAMAREIGRKKDETDLSYEKHKFNAIREVLQPLYKQVKELEQELSIHTARQMAVRYAEHILQRIDLRVAVDDAKDPDINVKHLIWVCHQIIKHAGYVPNEWSVTKLHRWIGYIQGVMTARGITTVQQERDDYRTMKQKLLAELSLPDQDI